MISLNRIKIIFTLALPIMGGAVSQSLLNLIDTLLVSSLGDVALAGVGIGGYAAFMSTAVVIGIGTSVQALVARRIGQGQFSKAAEPLSVGILVVFLLALPLFFFFHYFAADFMALLNKDPAVIKLATPYYSTRIAGIFAVGFNFCYRGYWTGVSKPMVYMRTLVIMHLCNIFISYALIFGKFGLPVMGTQGAALGTTISLYIGVLLYTVQCALKCKNQGYLTTIPSVETLRSILSLSLPSSIQQLFFAAGLTTLFWIIGQIGTPELAVAHVLINIILFLILPAIGLGMSATTLVSESLGEKNSENAYYWGCDIAKLAMILLFFCGLPLWVVPHEVLKLFFHSDALIELGCMPLTITGITIFFDGIAIVMTNSLIGAGATNTVMKVNIAMQWLVFLPCAYLIGPILGFGLLGVWVLQVSQRLAISSLFGFFWSKKQWSKIKL